MDKTLVVRGARIAFRIWDVGGKFINFLPKSGKLIMFTCLGQIRHF